MSNTHEKLRWGVLGTGSIAAKVLTVGIRRSGHYVEAVGSRSLNSAQTFASKHAITKAYGSYQELLDDAEIDAVYIALPSSLHREWTLKAAAAKKHVLCEKPVAFFTAEVVEMIEACKVAGVVFLDGTFFKHHPRNKLIKDMVDAGELGDVTSVFSQFSCDARDMTADAIRHRVDMERTGALGDMGWYTIRFGLHVYGYELPEKVVGTIVKRHPETGACTHFIGQLHFSNVSYTKCFVSCLKVVHSNLSWKNQNRVALFDTSFAQMDSQRTHISGTKAILAVDDAFVPWKGLIDMRNSTAFVGPQEDTFEMSKSAGVWETRRVPMNGIVEEVHMVNDFAACVEGSKSWLKWAEETIVIHKVIDALWESGELGSQPVTLSK
ncbi:hypothetical protein BC830DRAFT_340755 [Chytriomyces sp. MP71]|nr:hypothetical protein BC830DRAFT_340755 [Chytriomyces sp. MP71]